MASQGGPVRAAPQREPCGLRLLFAAATVLIAVRQTMEWLDDAHVLYAMLRSSQSAITDVWVSSVDGDAPARVFLPEAESPVAIH